MSLNYHQQRQLDSIESRLLRSDPQLAAMLAMFGRLCVGQRMPVREHAATRLDRVRQAAALIAKAVAAMSAAMDLFVSAVVALFTAVRAMFAAVRALFAAVLAMFAAVVMGGRARPPRRTYPQTRPSPGADGRPDPSRLELRRERQRRGAQSTAACPGPASGGRAPRCPLVIVDTRRHPL